MALFTYTKLSHTSISAFSSASSSSSSSSSTWIVYGFIHALPSHLQYSVHERPCLLQEQLFFEQAVPSAQQLQLMTSITLGRPTGCGAMTGMTPFSLVSHPKLVMSFVMAGGWLLSAAYHNIAWRWALNVCSIRFKSVGGSTLSGGGFFLFL